MQKVLWGILILVMLVSIPFLWERIAVEEANDGYDIIIPFEDIHEMNASGLEKDVIYSELTKNKGIQSIAFEPLNVLDLREDYHLFDVLNSRNFMRETGMSFDELPKKDGYYLQIHRPEHPYVEPLIEALNHELMAADKEVGVLDHDGRTYLVLPRSNYFNVPVTYDMEAIEFVKQYDLDVVLRMGNNFDVSIDSNPVLVQAEEIAQYEGANWMLFTGDEVPGANDAKLIAKTAERMNDWGLGVIMIENSDQAGIHVLVNKLETDPVRLHSLTLGKGEEDDLTHVYRSSRAIHERNIQMLFVNLLNKDLREDYSVGEGELSLAKTSDYFVEGVHRRTNGQPGEAGPFESFQQPMWFLIMTLIAGGAFTGLAAGTFHAKLILPVTIASMVLFVIIGLSGFDILVKLIVLGLAVLAPFFALIRIQEVRKWKGWTTALLSTLGITLTGAWFVVVMLYGVDYSLHLDSFRGVKILSVAPAVLLTALLVGYSWLKEPVKFWHLVVIAVVGAIVWFYLGRTGNEGIAIPYELEFRQMLENVFTVRPRTTEFLIGIPAIVFSLYLMKRGFYHARYLLIIGALGMASMVGTFTHLHTPLLVSIQRTVLGVAFGLVIGCLLILAWYLAERYLYPVIKRRFQL